MLMEMFTKENGKMIRLTALEGTCILMALDMKAIGKKTNNTAKEQKPGLMELATWENISKEKSMDKVASSGLTSQLMMASSLTIIFTESESTFGPIKERTMESGKTTRCTEKEFSNGLMEEGTKESTLTIRNRDSEFSHGRMEESMKDTGRTENNTEEELTTLRREK